MSLKVTRLSGDTYALRIDGRLKAIVGRVVSEKLPAEQGADRFAARWPVIVQILGVTGYLYWRYDVTTGHRVALRGAELPAMSKEQWQALRRGMVLRDPVDANVMYRMVLKGEVTNGTDAEAR